MQNNNGNYLEISKNTKIDADKILKDLDLLKILKEFGDVRIGGSYFTDLMFGPDIDIEVISENPRQSAIDFFNKILELRLFQKQEFGDFEKFERENRPKSFIVVCKIEFNQRKWEIEIWFRKEFNLENIELENKLIILNQEKRDKILIMKYQRQQNNLDKKHLSSFEIYKNVLGE